MIRIRSSKDVSEPTLIGFEATLTTAFGIYEFSSNGPIIDPMPLFSGGRFGAIAWPRSRFQLCPGVAIEQQMFVSAEGSDTAISWELQGLSVSAQLVVRPYFGGCAPRGYRDVGFHFDSEQQGGRLIWMPRVYGPKIVADTNGRYNDEPLRLAREIAQRPAGAEELIAPGRFEFALNAHPSVLIFSIDGDSKTAGQQQIGAFLAGLLANHAHARDATIAGRTPTAEPILRAVAA